MKTEAYRLMEDLEQTHWWYQARREIICSVVARFFSSPGQLLDYGCGTGATAARLGAMGYRVIGAEINPDMLAGCRNRGLATIDLGKEPVPDKSADCVLACDVLEHAEDDVGLLKTLRTTLRPGGLLIGTVPAYEFLWSGEDYVSNHCRRYTRSRLRKALRAADYDIFWSSYFNTLLFPLAFSVILAKRLFRPRDMYRSNVESTVGWQNTVLRAIFLQERWLLKWLRCPFGLSIIFVAQPREVAIGTELPPISSVASGPDPQGSSAAGSQVNV
jgi:SAM-dependent methyltransferase